MPVDRSLRGGTRRGLLAIAVLFALDAALAFSESRVGAAMVYAVFVLTAAGLRTYTTPASWPAAEAALRCWFGGSSKGGGA